MCSARGRRPLLTSPVRRDAGAVGAGRSTEPAGPALGCVDEHAFTVRRGTVVDRLEAVPGCESREPECRSGRKPYGPGRLGVGHVQMPRRPVVIRQIRPDCELAEEVIEDARRLRWFGVEDRGPGQRS
jgi:hypothetical protein